MKPIRDLNRECSITLNEPVVVRQMTEEERKRYAKVDPPKKPKPVDFPPYRKRIR